MPPIPLTLFLLFPVRSLRTHYVHALFFLVRDPVRFGGVDPVIFATAYNEDQVQERDASGRRQISRHEKKTSKCSLSTFGATMMIRVALLRRGV